MKKRTTPIAERRRKAYSYIRFSTPEQAKGDSLRRQTKAAAAYAEAHNLDLDDKLTFRDLGISAFRGKNAETGKLAEFIEAARLGVVEPGSVLLVENLDRISRLPALDAVNLLNDICKAGVTVVTLNNGTIYTKESLRTDLGSLLNAIIAASQGNLQNVDKADRLRDAWIGKKEKAKADKEIITAMAPCWLKPNKDRTGWVIDKAKAKIVKRIFDLTLKGVGVNKLAMTFNEQGVPAIGRPRRRREDAAGAGAPGKWQVTFIQKLLANPAVIGEFHDHRREYDHDTGKYTRVSTGEKIKDYYPRIVEREVFRKVAAQLAGRRGKARARNGRISNLFAGLSRCPCPGCGNSMSSVNKGNGSKVYLVCSAARIKAGCTYHAVRHDDVEKAFLAAAEDLVRCIPSGDSKADSELEALQRTIEERECGLDEAKDIFRREPSRFLASEIRKEEAELIELQNRQRELVSKVEAGNTKVLAARARELSGVLPAPFSVVKDDGSEAPAPINRDAINAVLHRIFDHVVIDYRRGDLVIVWRNGAKTRIKYGKPMPRKKAA